MSGRSLLRLRGVSRVYNEGAPNAVTALRSIDLDVDAGEFVAIVGPSGGGKSTLLATLGLLDTPTAGTYEIDNIQSTSLSERRRTRLRAKTLGFVFQAFHLLDRRPLIHSVEMGLLYRGLPRATRRERALEALDRVGLRDRAEAIAGELSGGQRQRAAIARAFAGDCAILLADEPTGNLDSGNGEIVLQEIRRLHESGTTVIVATHSEEIARAAQRRIRIVDGQITEDSGRMSGAASASSEGEWSADHTATTTVLPRVGRWGNACRDAIASLASRPRQAAALTLAVALAVGLIVVSLGLGETARAQVADTFDRHANREVSAHVVTTPDQRLDADAAVRRIASLAGVESAAAMVARGPISLSSLGGTATVTAQLVNGDFVASTGSEVSWAGGQERDLGGDSIVIGRTLAERIGLGPLDATPTIDVGGRRLVVVGVLESSQRYPDLAGQIVASITTPLGLTQWEDDVTLAVRVRTGAARQVGQQLAVAIDPYAPEQVVVNVPIDVSTIRQSIEGGVQIALAAFAALSALIAVATLANAIGLSVQSRRGEFGLRRALGSQAGQLAGLVTLESAVIGLVGGALGLVAGLTAILGFTISQRWMPIFDLRIAPVAVGAGVLLAVLSSLVGAVRAARIEPATALRQ